MDVFTPQLVSVTSRGALVILAIGNVVRSLEFDVALRVAEEMSQAAKLAKRKCGDASRRYRTAGTLHDATAEKEAVSRFNRSTPERLSEIEAYTDGFVVNLRVGRDILGIPYEAALTISQWIRLRAKEARNAVGETAHWSDLVKPVHAEVRSP